MTLDPKTFRNTMGMFATGVAVIAVNHEGNVHAMTANAVSALSLEPMLVFFCPSKHASLSELLPNSETFSINFLRDEQQAVSTYFAGGWKKDAPTPFRFTHADGAPRLEGRLATVSCKTQQILDGGDHWLVIGAVTGIHHGIEPHHPVLFFKGRYQVIDQSSSAPAPTLVNVSDEPAMVYYHD